MINPEPSLVKSDSGFSEKSAHIIANNDDDLDFDEVDQAAVQFKRPEISLEKAKLIFDKRLASSTYQDDDEYSEDVESQHGGDVNANGISCSIIDLFSLHRHGLYMYFFRYRRCSFT